MGITHPTREPAGSWEPSQQARVHGRAAAPWAVSFHRGMAEPVHKSPYEKQGGFLALDFPGYVGDARHGRVTKPVSDPLSGSSRGCNSLFFPFLTACLHVSPGSQPWEAAIKPCPLFTQPPSPLLRLQSCPGAWAWAVT